MLHNPPTVSPTSANHDAGFWYTMYEKSWAQSGCSKKLPLPYNNINDCPQYDSQESCCAGAYAGQVSMACVCDTPNPPLKCPGVVTYTATTTTATVSSTLVLEDITIPSDSTAKEALINDLDSIIMAIALQLAWEVAEELF